MRGENYLAFEHLTSENGSPPHARGKLDFVFIQRAFFGITPACAGKTGLPRNIANSLTDHPRMRGENFRPPVDVT